MICGWLSL